MIENSKFISKSEFNIKNILLVVFGILFFGFLIFIFNTYVPIKNEQEEYLKITFSILFGGFIIYCFYYLLNLKKITVYKDYFVIEKLFSSRKYFFSDFISYWSEFNEGKYNSWTEYFFILKDNSKIKLIDNEYSNFDAFINSIIKNVKRNNDINQKMNRPRYLKYSIICLIISISLLYFSSYFYDFNKVENKDLVYVSGL